jgi:tetratricopeptide (TPR) repeat protein/tRNA A-37 threonylcarbamoyl transferase component Bud32
MQCLDPNTIVALVEGRLSAGERDAIDLHVDDCEACRRAVAAAVAGITPARTERITVPLDGSRGDRTHHRGDLIGRYAIEEVIGVGGMGVVYAARDPELQRRVALKVLRERSTDRTCRLLEEARAVARLAHPNVVTVHDVGRTEAGAPFLAMELVAGSTLRVWLARERRPAREIARVFADAGRGLAAAHAAGLVHGDVKPDNILVGDDGRVRVTDFGASRAMAETSGDVRVVHGTPEYMAPEQRRGGPITPAADQYSFAVALHEALFGERPERNAPAPRHRGALGRLIARALAPASEARFPSMAALVAALERIRRRRAIAITGAIAAAIAVAAVPLLLRPAATIAAAGCDPGPRVDGLWNRASQEAVRTRFAASGATYAASSWRGLDRAVRDYLGRWSGAYRRACAGPAPTARLLACLEGRRRDLAELLDQLEAASPPLVERAVAAVGGLSPPEMCLDLRTAGPDDRAPQLASLRDQLRRARVLADQVRLDDAIALASGVARRAGALGARAIEGEALLARGLFESRAGRVELAEATLARAARAADEATDDVLRARAWQERAAVARARGRHDEAIAHLAVAAAALERAGRPELATAELLWIRAGVQSELGRQSEARADMERSVAIYDRLLGPDSVKAANALNQLANIDREEGLIDRAIERHARALRVLQAALGRDHPVAAAVEGNLCADQVSAGRFEPALDHCQATLAAFTRSLGPDHVKTGMAEAGLAEVHAGLGAFDEATRHGRRAIEILTAAAGPDHPHTATALLYLGTVERRLGEPAAGEHLERAAAALEQHFAPPHPLLAEALLQRGLWRAGAGRSTAALADLARARAMAGSDPVAAGRALSATGDALLAAGRIAEARARYQEALDLLSSRAGPAAPLARFGLARAIAREGHQRERANALAGEARRELTALGAPAAPELAALDRWLSAR